MLFFSIEFLFYFLPLVLLGYYLLRFSVPAQNVWLLFASLFFYAWGEWRFFLLLLASVLVNYFLGKAIDRLRADREKARKILLFSCIFNVGILFIFKYFAFVVRNVGSLVTFSDFTFANFLLPLGISFYTFQAISYVVDIYRSEQAVTHNLLHTALYITFFPQILCGPINRYNDIAAQIRQRTVTQAGFCAGVCRFILGMAKKVIIANSIGTIADQCFTLSAMSGVTERVPVTLAWLGAVCYALQLFFDFSGYTDMAIGLANMFGFRFAENFNYPYIAASIADFWRRWHMSLTAWFREYVYIPLGGSRVENNDKMVRNTFIVWLFIGLWHGAEWTFVLWGVWNFIFIIFERVVDFQKRKIPAFFRHFYVLLVTIIGLLMVRAFDIYQATLYISNMMGLNNNGFFSDLALVFLREYWLFILLALVFSTPVARILSERLRQSKAGRLLFALYPVMMLALFIVTAAYIMKGSCNPFIYFNF